MPSISISKFEVTNDQPKIHIFLSILECDFMIKFKINDYLHQLLAYM